MVFEKNEETINQKYDGYVNLYTNSMRWNSYLSQGIFSSLEEAKEDAELAESCAPDMTVSIYGLTCVCEGEGKPSEEFEDW